MSDAVYIPPSVYLNALEPRPEPDYEDDDEIEEPCDVCNSSPCYCDWLYERAAERARGWD